MSAEQTIAYRVYKDGKSLLGTSTVELSEISFLSETLSGSGIAGEMEVPTLGMTGPLSATFNWISQNRDYFSVLDVSASTNLELRAAVQEVDETTGVRSSKAYRMSMLTMPKSAKLGTMETGKQQGSSTEFELSRLLIEIAGEEKLLIDKVNFIYRVNGTDMLAKVRADLGLEF